MKNVKDKFYEIMSLTDEHSSTDDKEMLLINKDMEHISYWLANICEEYLNMHQQIATLRTPGGGDTTYREGYHRYSNRSIGCIGLRITSKSIIPGIDHTKQLMSVN